MKNNLFAIALIILSTLNIYSQDFDGYWTGNFEKLNNLQIGFNITKEINEKGETIYLSKIDVPEQGVMNFGLDTIKVKGDSITINSKIISFTYKGKLHKANDSKLDSITGIYTQLTNKLPLTLKRDKPLEINRPQTPTPPYPYITKELKIVNKKDNIKLAGTLTLPDTIRKFPTIILIAGSGPNNRDEEIFGHKPFLVIADYFTKNGFAVFRFDKRGVEESEGDYSTATIYDFANDVNEIVNYLSNHKNIKKDAIGLIGHSEGGIIAPLVSSKNNNVSYIVLLAGMAIDGVSCLNSQYETLLKMQYGDTKNTKKLIKNFKKTNKIIANWNYNYKDTLKLTKELNKRWDLLKNTMPTNTSKEDYLNLEIKNNTNPWIISFLKINPKKYLNQTKCPVLALNGEKDYQVVAKDNLRSIEKELKKGGNKNYTIKSYPKLNHLFQESYTGLAFEYSKIEQTIAPYVLEDMFNWCKKIME